MIYLKLFWDFFRVSCFTFGGAYGAIPLIRDMVLGNGWLTDERLSYMIAVSESTPGPIMVNLATYIGSDQAGFWGSLVATVGVVLPAYLVILLIVSILGNFMKNRYVQAVLQGLKPCVVGIVLATGVFMVLRNLLPLSGGVVYDLHGIIITAILAGIMVLYPKLTKKKLSPIALILCAAVCGMAVYGI
jgi:chromate transporter